MSTSTQSWSAATTFYALASVCIVTYVLWIGSSILIPIVLAGLVWFALASVARLFMQIGPAFVGKILLSHLMAWLMLILISWLIYTVIGQSVVEFMAALPSYEIALAERAAGVVDWVQTSFSAISNLFPGLFSATDVEPLAAQITAEEAGEDAADVVGQLVQTAVQSLRAYVPTVAGTVLATTQSTIIWIGFVLIYLIFFYAESSSFPTKLAALNREEADHHRWSTLIGFILTRLAAYIRIKTITSALTGFLGYLLMVSLDVNFAILFAMFLFLLNYIPTVGSLISSALPVILFLVDPNFTAGKWFILVFGLLFIQQGVGSVLEPRLLASSFNISSILVLASLLFWASIWGVFGMLISAPITAALVILLANFEGSRQFAIILSADGDIEKLRP